MITRGLSDVEKRTIIATGIGLLGERFKSREANILLAAIAFQESEFFYRKQIVGPARGLWQFEKGGAVKGVLFTARTQPFAVHLCVARGVHPIMDDVYEKLSEDDVLAAGFARLLLWSDRKPLPIESEQAWQYYLRNWRPGKPHPERWPKAWKRAMSLYTSANGVSDFSSN